MQNGDGRENSVAPSSGWRRACPNNFAPMQMVTTFDCCRGDVTSEQLTLSLFLAVQSGHATLAEHLVRRHGVDPDSRFSMKNNPVLNAAIQSANLHMVNVLIACGASVNQADFVDNDTPLHLAVSLGCVDIALALLSERANPNSQNKKGDTPVHIAAKSGKPELLKLLVDCGGNVEKRDGAGRTALTIACQSGHVYIVYYLLLHVGASVQSQDALFNCPLHYAYSLPSFVLDLFLRRGANVDAINVHGVTPLLSSTASALSVTDKAYDDLFYGAFRWFVRHTGNINHCCFVTRRSALATAVSQGNTSAVKLLLKHGANPNLVDLTRTLPLMRIADTASPHMLILFHRHGACFGLLSADNLSRLLKNQCSQCMVDKCACQVLLGKLVKENKFNIPSLEIFAAVSLRRYWLFAFDQFLMESNLPAALKRRYLSANFDNL